MSFSEMSPFIYWKEIIPLSMRNEVILLTSEAEKPCLHPSSADCVVTAARHRVITLF